MQLLQTRIWYAYLLGHSLKFIIIVGDISYSVCLQPHWTSLQPRQCHLVPVGVSQTWYTLLLQSN